MRGLKVLLTKLQQVRQVMQDAADFILQTTPALHKIALTLLVVLEANNADYQS